MTRRPPKILVFLQGTAFIPPVMRGLQREERVALSRRQDPALVDADPIAAAGALEKVRAWRRAGADVVYLCSRRSAESAARDRNALRRLGFPDGRLLWRQDSETYGTVAAREHPDVIVEDDCESIGPDEITYGRLPEALRASIRSVIVPEFGGLAHLADDPDQLGR